MNRADLDLYSNIKEKQRALDVCDMSMSYTLDIREILGAERAEKFRKEWECAYRQLAQILEYARAYAQRRCLE